MKMIRIFRHIDCEGPAYLETILQNQRIDYEIICIDQGEAVITELENVAGLVFMGGTMSANDELAWIKEEIRLIKSARERNIPTLGICLGSQLMAKAYGAQIWPGPCMELGWQPIEAQGHSSWLVDLPQGFDAFHWHGETFTLPEGAELLFSSKLYANQAFALGPHLALQFHVEMQADLIRHWLDLYKTDLNKSCDKKHTDQITASRLISENLEEKVVNLQSVADILISKWLANIVT